MPLEVKVHNIILIAALLLLLPLSVKSQEVKEVMRLKTVVIDPGHGGKDPGAISRNQKYFEKDITLSVALKLGNLIKQKYPHIKVVYTRSTDKYVVLSQRAEIANRNKADLFISIHVNSAKDTRAKGTETFVMGLHKSDDNLEVCKTENSVIVIEDDYQTKYQGFDPNSPESYIIFSLMQNVHQEQSIMMAASVQEQFAKGPITVNRGVKQGGLLVLWKTTMPAILTEIGFISNSADCQVLVSKSGQDQFAKRLFNAFEVYKRGIEGVYDKDGDMQLQQNGREETPKTAPAKKEIVKEAATPEKKEPVKETAAPAKKEPVKENVSDFYAVQILSVGKPLKKGAYDLKGRDDAGYVKVGNLYKYYIGKHSLRKDAVKAMGELRKTFPGAFVIHIKDNVIVK